MGLNNVGKTAALVAALFAGVVGGGAVAFAVPQQGDPAQPSAPNPTADEARDAPVYAVNEAGQTYGAAPEYEVAPEAQPDLVLVIATNGREGFVPWAIMFPPLPRTPEEALASTVHAGTTTPVFDTDGRTIIGEFVFTPIEETR